MTGAQDVYALSRAMLADQDGMVVVLKVFIDESGTHNTSPATIVAAYIGRSKDWRDWTKKWNRAKRPIKVYHAVDAASLRGEFKNWTKEEVSALAAKLLPIIAESEIAAIVIGMDMKAFEDALAGRGDLKKIFGNPYGACFHWLIQVIMNLVADTGNKERIAFYHEQNDYHGEAYEAFDWIRKNGNRNSNAISLTFGGKNDYAPLQAADILAYEANKRLRNPDAPERRAWTAMGASKFFAQYGSSNMAELVSNLEKIQAGEPVSPNYDLGWNRSVMKFVQGRSS